MAAKRWTLLDAPNRIHADDVEITSRDAPGSTAGLRVTKRTLRGGLSERLELLEINNGALRAAVLPGRGMGIWKLWHGERAIGWSSPLLGPVHPMYVPVAEPSGLGWLSGFDELLVRCGLESNGAPDFDAQGRLLYPLHGRVANLPANKVEVEIDGGRVSVTGTVDESRFHFQKLRLVSTVTLEAGSLRLQIHDEVQNLSGQPAGMQMLYHVNFGPPWAAPGSRVVLPFAQMCPRDADAAAGVDRWNTLGPPKAGSVEHVYCFAPRSDERGWTSVLLIDPESQRGVSVQFDTRRLPHFTLWKNTPPTEDGYVTGLEPGTNFPNPRTYEQSQGRVVPLEAGQSVAFDLAIEIHPDAAAVKAAEQRIASLQGDTRPTVHRLPQQGWSAAAG